MKNTYFGWEFRPAVELFGHKVCAALTLPSVTIEWCEGRHQFQGQDSPRQRAR